MGQHEQKCKEKTNLRKLKIQKQEKGLAVHHAETGHLFEIRKGSNLANLKRGYEISEIWDPFLHKPP